MRYRYSAEASTYNGNSTVYSSAAGGVCVCVCCELCVEVTYELVGGTFGIRIHLCTGGTSGICVRIHLCTEGNCGLRWRNRGNLNPTEI